MVKVKGKSKRKRQIEKRDQQDGKRFLFTVIGVAIVLMLLMWGLYSGVS